MCVGGSLSCLPQQTKAMARLHITSFVSPMALQIHSPHHCRSDMLLRSQRHHPRRLPPLTTIACCFEASSERHHQAYLPHSFH